MISFQLLQLMVNASAEAFSLSYLSANSREVIDGGTKNRIWSFPPIYSLANLALLPFITLFPVIPFELVLLGTAVVVGSIFYIASVAHENKITEGQKTKDEKKPKEIKTLPWGLHDNQYVTGAALFLSRYLAYPLLAFYGLSLVACIFLGSPLYACISLGMYALAQLYQHGYIPDFLETPYLYLNITMALFAVCGVTSVLGIALSVSLVAFTVVDYIRCYVWGEDSPTVQFPMTDASKRMKVPSVEQNNAEATKQFESLVQMHQMHRDDAELHVTFDHFYASYQIVNKLLEGAPEVDYKKYITLFDAIDFKDGAFQERMLVEMALHDKFNGTAISEHCQTLGLPKKTEVSEVRIAYLKQEMSEFVARLQQFSYRDFTHQQVLTMHRYARLLLSTIEEYPKNKQAHLLLSIAVRCGSHCNGAYFEHLSDLALKENLLFAPSLTLQEKAMLTAQETREAFFRTYYHTLASVLKKELFHFWILWADTGDYCTYEDFIYFFGANFYLLNASFTPGFRDIFEVLRDRVVPFIFREQGRLFCDHYTVDYLVLQVVNPEKKLYKIFEAWCAEHQVSLLDEYHMLRFKSDSAELRALAELMLLDLNIVALKKPYIQPEVEPADSKVNTWSLSGFSMFKQEDSTYDGGDVKSSTYGLGSC